MLVAKEDWVILGEWFLERPLVLGVLYAAAGLLVCARRHRAGGGGRWLSFLIFPFHVALGFLLAPVLDAVWSAVAAVPADVWRTALAVMFLLLLCLCLVGR